MEQGGQSNGGREGERERGKGSRVVLFPGESLCESMGRTQLVTSDSTISRLITSDYNMHPTNINISLITTSYYCGNNAPYFIWG